MPNVDHPRGLQPYEYVLHRGTYNIPAAYAQDLFIGDPVIGTAGVGGEGKLINIATAGNGNPILGAILAIYDSNGDPLPYWASGTAGTGTVLVADDPFQYYVCQGDGDTSFLDIEDANGNINLVAGTGSTVNYRSGWELDDSQTGGAVADDQIRLVGPVNRIDNEVGLANADWVCLINNHQRLQGVVGVGV
jgi:hypothetical protein